MFAGVATTLYFGQAGRLLKLFVFVAYPVILFITFHACVECVRKANTLSTNCSKDVRPRTAFQLLLH